MKLPQPDDYPDSGNGYYQPNCLTMAILLTSAALMFVCVVILLQHTIGVR